MIVNEKVKKAHSHHLRHFVRDYGMAFVLLLLGVLFSLLTIEEQHPTGAEAGRQVAESIVDRLGAGANVLIVTRATSDDRVFAAATAKELNRQGANVQGTVSGLPADARKEIVAILERGDSIDAIAANDVTAKWTVFERFEEVGADKCVTPTPYYWPNFLKTSNLIGVANQTAIYAIIAIGMTMVIISAGIDLSVGSLVALSAVITAKLVRDVGGGEDAPVIAVMIGCYYGILACAAAGFFNGIMVTQFKVPPFIVTLGMMMMASGLSFRLTDGRSISNLPSSFGWLGGESSFGIPHPVFLMIGLYIVAHFVMSRTVFGRYIYAIGGNAEAARLAGVPVKRTQLAVYCICGALAGLGGVLLASKLAAGDPKFGNMYELEVIAAVVVGGTSLMGGHGKILGTLIGAFIITVIKNGMNLTNVDPFNQKIVLGAVLLIAVLIDLLKRKASE